MACSSHPPWRPTSGSIVYPAQLGPASVVLDIGKTVSKASLWRPDGTLIKRCTRSNPRIHLERYDALDAAGIESWLTQILPDFARSAEVSSIIPVAHGAAAAIVRGNRLSTPPFDYESPIPDAVRHDYDQLRDAFALTGSPALANGLNLGAQLFYQQTLQPHLLPEDALILPWPQYWSWRLSGAAASEVTSLGCHSDLWRPRECAPSHLSVSRGWAAHIAPLHVAADVLGALTADWCERTGLSRHIHVHCGLHDSNAALFAARAYPEIAGRDFTVLSTGTWFVAMRSLTDAAGFEIETLPEARDCLVNVDVHGKPVPSARFMGGREIELLTGADAIRIEQAAHQGALQDALPRVLAAGAAVLPSFAPGSGPYGNRPGSWMSPPIDPYERAAAVALYVALLADSSLDLIGAGNALLVEGRFAESELFVRALASLRATSIVYRAPAQHEVAFGALRVLYPTLRPQAALARVIPLDHDLSDYRQRWRQLAHSNSSHSRQESALTGRFAP
jgi:sugar (pentulose or hexulose) kinase